jgi:ubiquinone/menaquinone biosynthesis C-methylase UbiE
MGGVIESLIGVWQRLLGSLYRIEERQADLQAHNQAVIQSTVRYDMVAYPGEDYYLLQYWHWIAGYLESKHMPRAGSYLDAGCGQGRVTIRLADWCAPDGKVLGIDLSEIAVRRAETYATARQVGNASFAVSDILAFLRTCSDATYDAILFLEVSFFFPGFRQAIQEMRRVLKSGGLLFASFRPQYFNVLSSLRNGRRWHDVQTVLQSREGLLWGGNTSFTWQTSTEIRDLFATLGFDVLQRAGIGCCSGLPGEPHHGIASPARLGDSDREKLLSLELALGPALPDCGRYMLFVAEKCASDPA